MRNGERGSATVWVLALSTVLALLGAAIVLVGAAVVARHRAGAAADLAALAGAARAARADPDPCAAATEVAVANGAEVSACRIESGVLQVSVGVTVRLGRLGLHTATGRARAGPVGSGGSG